MKKLLKKAKEVFSPLPRFAENDIMDASPETMEARAEKTEAGYLAMPHLEAGDIQSLKSFVRGHGEQTVLPDDCQYGDNDLCVVEA